MFVAYIFIRKIKRCHILISNKEIIKLLLEKIWKKVLSNYCNIVIKKIEFLNSGKLRSLFFIYFFKLINVKIFDE